MAGTLAIVSGVLLKNPAATGYVFAFVKGEGLSEHTAPFDALVIGVEGEAEIQIAGEKHWPREGEMITMPASQPHAVQATSDFKMLLVMIKGIKKQGSADLNPCLMRCVCRRQWSGRTRWKRHYLVDV